jgi:hypothetical protein
MTCEIFSHDSTLYMTIFDFHFLSLSLQTFLPFIILPQCLVFLPSIYYSFFIVFPSPLLLLMALFPSLLPYGFVYSLGCTQYPNNGYKGSFPRARAAGTLSWPVTSIYCQSQEWPLTCMAYCRFAEWIQHSGNYILSLKNGVFWDVTPCGSCKNRCFAGT